MKRGIKIVLILLVLLAVLFLALFLFGNDELEQSFIGEGRLAALPQNADILFVSNRDTGGRRTEIYSLDIETNETKRITFTNEHHFIMGIYNRRYLLTSRAEKDTNKPEGLGDEDRRALWIIDLETKKETRLTSIKNNAEGDSFSSDGQWIVFMMTLKNEQQADIYKIKIDGTELTKLTDTKTSVEGDPEFSSDGKEIVFSYLDGLDKEPRFIIKKMDANGNNQQIVYDGGMGISIGPFPPGNFDPSWSKDGEWIVFERAVLQGGNFGSGTWHIFKVKTDGSNLTDLSELGNHSNRAEYLPSFSNDGKWIVFGSIHQAEKSEDSFSDIFKMDEKTGEIKRLTYISDNKYPVWIK